MKSKWSGKQGVDAENKNTTDDIQNTDEND